MITEIDIWRATSLMLKHYGGNAEVEKREPLDELGDLDGAAVWRRIMHTVAELANTTPAGPVN